MGSSIIIQKGGMNPKEWLERNTFHHSAFSDLDELIERKKADNCRVSVGIPTLNEGETIYNEVKVLREHLIEKFPLLDEIAVIDSGSSDTTEMEATRAGAKFYLASEILPHMGAVKGKGENLWKSLHVLEGDIIVWIDADIKNISPKFVYGILGPILRHKEIGYVKAFYDRPIRMEEELRLSGGGRVSEILIRPLLSLCYPDLAYFLQPLAGEYAGRRSILEEMPFSIGYGVEIGLLLEIYRKFGLGQLAQVDLDLRIHRNRSIYDLGKMSFNILQTFFRIAQRQDKLTIDWDLSEEMIQFLGKGEKWIPQTCTFQDTERPPMKSLAAYAEKRKNYI